MSYAVREQFISIQGEGAQAGTKAAFVRFAGCNAWNGTEAGRQSLGAGACARWCDTDLVGGEKLEAAEIVARMGQPWAPRALCVVTGGEPGLQLDVDLLRAIKLAGWRVAVETNGTIETAAINGCDWITCSPKLLTDAKLRHAHELKVVLPGALPPLSGWNEVTLNALATGGGWGQMFVQPQGGPEYEQNVQRCVQWVLEHPEWRLGVQLHKAIGLR
jgi:organic radical activating enzyme